MQITAIGHSHPLQFRGQKTTNEAALKHQTAAQLQEMLINDEDPYVGEIPERMRPKYLSANGFLEILDTLADKLRNAPKSSPRSILKKIDKYNPPGCQLPIREIGEGRMGRVYKLGHSPDAFALKVYKEDWESDALTDQAEEAPFAETANGLYLTHSNTRDVSRFYVSNPFAKWALTEYIGKKSKLGNRPGPTLEEQGLALSDGGNRLNYVNGIRVDHGDTLYQFNRLTGAANRAFP